ncbi:MAG: hypothetical protein ACD_45C00655G0002 [uncultured bacterium]|nr:MAG: hypothetical protein ACD_45C00655G0002 [uncultured bacterium]
MSRYKIYGNGLFDRLFGAATDGCKKSFDFYKDRVEPQDETRQQVDRYYPDAWLRVDALRKYAQLRNYEPNNKKNYCIG